MKNIFLHQFLGKTNSPIQKKAPSLLFQALFLGVLGMVLLNTATQAQITGTVFRDFNANGTYQTIPASGTYAYGEPGVAGITVVAFTTAGSFTTTTGSAGTYAFTAGQLPANTQARLEFSGFSTGNLDYEGSQSSVASERTSSVQFVTAGASTIANFGINYPTDYCQDNPPIATACYVFGNQTGGANAADPVFITFPFNAGSRSILTNEGVTAASGTVGTAYPGAYDQPTAHTIMTAANQVGTTFGVAYARGTRTFYSASYFKKHAGFGPSGPGAIYRINGTTGAVIGTFTVPNATLNRHDATNYNTDNSNLGWDAVGKTSLGGMDLSDDEQTLYVMNLENRNLYSLNATTGAVIANQAITTAAGCPTADVRPFAVEYHRGTLYVGLVCNAESTPTSTANLQGYIYTVDPTTLVRSASPVFQFPLTYPRGKAANSGPGSWLPWRTTYTNIGTGANTPATVNRIVYPMPMLTNIDFDANNDLIIGLRDRLGDIAGHNTADNPNAPTLLTQGRMAGDILRAASTGVNTWTLESNGRVGGRGTSRQNTNQGPGGAEFYQGDSYPVSSSVTVTTPYAITSVTPTYNYTIFGGESTVGPGQLTTSANGYLGFGENHDEIALGTVLQIPGQGELMALVFDPVPDNNADGFYDGGVRRMSNVTGSWAQSYRIYNGEADSNDNFGKAAGLSEPVAQCNLAPIEIGNRIWIDTDQDGIQDPNENPLAGVTVQLFAPAISTTVPIATAVTDARGLYVFSSASTSAITANTVLQLRIPSTQTALAAYRFSLANQGNNDLIDSDFTLGTTFASTSFTTGTAGQNNFSFDAGVVVCSFTATTTASSNAVCVNQPVVLTTQVTPAGSYTYNVTGPAGVTVTGGTTATATVTGLSTGVNNLTVTISSGPACFTTNVVSVTASATPLLALTASQSAICLGQTVTLAAPVGGIVGAGIVSFGVLGPLGNVLNPVTTNVFSPTATTTFIASVPIAGGLGGVLTSCPVTVVVNQPPVIAPLGLSVCAGTGVLNLSALTGTGSSLSVLSGLTNIFRPGSTTTGVGLTGPASVSVGVNTFNVVSTNPAGCSTNAPISVTGIATPAVGPLALSLCVGTNLDLTSLTGLAGLTNVFRTGNALGLGTVVGTPTAVSVGVGVNLFNVVSTNPAGCTTATPISVTGVPTPMVAPIALSVCVGTNVNLSSLTGLTGLTNVFRTGNALGLGTVVGTPTSVSVGAGVNLFNVVSTNPAGCTTATPISVTGVAIPVVAPINLSLCVGTNLDLTSLTGLTGLTNVFRTGNALGLGTVLGTPTSVSVGAGVSLFNVVSTAPTGCTTATPISVTGVNAPVVAPIALSLCVGTNLDLTSLTGLSGLTNVFRTGNALGLGTVLGTPTAISVGAGVNLFNVVSTAPTGCTTATPISVTGVAAPAVAPIALSVCVGTSVNLSSLTGLTGLTNVFRTGNALGLGTVVGTPTAVSVGAGVNLFNVVSTAPTGCTTATPISVTGVAAPVVGPLALSLCVGANLDLTSLSGLAGLTNVFRTGNALGLGTVVSTPTAVSIGTGVNLFNVVSTSPFGCTTATPISVTGVPAPVVGPFALSLCVGTNLDLTSLSGLTGLTNVFRTGNALGLGTVLGTPTAISVGAGVNLFNVVSTSPFGCTTATPISVTGVAAPAVAPIALSVCVGTNVNLSSLTGLTGLTNVFRTGNALGLGTVVGTPTSVSVGAGVNLFNVVSTAPTGCTTATPISVTGVANPVVAPIALSLCVGANLDLTSLTGLAGLTNVFRTGNALGLGTVVGTPTSVSVGTGVNLFNVVSTSPFGCTTATPISVTGVPAPVVGPFALSLCVGTNLDLTSLSGLAGLTNVFRTGNALGLGTVLGTPTAISVGAGVNLFNVVSTSPFGCTTATPISVTGVPAPVVAPIALSVCVGTTVNLASLTGLTGLTNVFRTGNALGLGTILGTPTSVSVGAGVNLFNVVSTAPTGCTTATPISVTGVAAPVVGPLALSLCVGTNLDLTSLSGLAGLTNVFRTGNLLGLGTVVGTPTAVSIGAGVNLFNVVSTSPFGCTTATPISVTGVPAPVVGPLALSLCVGTNLDLTSLSGLAGLTNVFRTGNLLGLGTVLGTPTAISVGAGVNLFNVVSTSPFGCTTATPISVTGVPTPAVAPIALSLCVGTNLDLTSLSGLAGLTNVFRTGNALGLGTILGTPSSVSVGAGVTLFNVVSSNPSGCTTATPISVTGVNAPVVAPIALSLCAGTNLDLTSLSGLAGLTNVFRTGNLLGLGTVVGTPTAVNIGAGVNLFNVISSNPLGCTTATPISVTGITTATILPINLSLCAGTTLDLTGLSGLGSLTNIFRTGNVIGLGTLVSTPTAVSIGAGLNLFNVVSTTPLGCTTSSPISITGVNPPVVAPIALSLCVGTNLDLTSLSGLAGLTNVFRTGNALGLGTLLGTPTAVSIGAGVNLFNVVSSDPLGCSTATPISVTGVPAPVVGPFALSLCVGTNLDLTSLSGLTGLTNVFRTGNALGLGTILSTPTAISVGAGVNLFNVVSTSPFGCTTVTPISVTGVNPPVVAPIALSLCVGTNLNLTSLTGLAGLTNVFRTGNVLGLGTLLGTPTAVSIGAGVNLFNVLSTAPTGCTTATPISVTGVPAPVVGPLALSLCVGANLDLTSLSGLAGLTNVFRTGNALGLGTVVGTPTAVSIGAGVNLFNVVSTSPFGCTTATPISVTGVPTPVVGPLALSLCVGTNLDLTSLSGLAGLTNVFRTGNVLGLGTILSTPTAISVGAGVNLFNVVSTSPFGCTTATPISVTGITPPVVAPIALSLCVGANLDLTSLTGLAGLTNVFRTGNLLGLGTVVGTPAALSVTTGVNLFNVVSTAPTGCTTATPISVTGVAAPVVGPLALSLCVGTNLDLTSLTGLAGLTNVFRTGNALGLGTILGTPTAVSIGAGVNLFNVVSTSPFGCTTATPISVTGVPAPVIGPLALSLCVGTNLDLTSLSGLAGLTNVFRTGNALGLGTILSTPTAISVGAGVNLFNVVSTSPFGCTTATPISVTGVTPPTVAPIALSLCVGANLDLTSLTGLAGLTNVFRTGNVLGLGTVVGTPAALSVGAGVNLFNVVSTAPTGCTTATPISVTGVPTPVVSPIALSLCVGTNLDLTSLTGLAGLTNVFRTGNLLGLGTVVGTPTAVSIGTGVNLFNVVSTSPFGCTTATPISVTGVDAPVVAPINLSLCVGTDLNLTSLSGLAGLTNVFRTGNLLGLGTVISTPTAVSVGLGVNLFNVVSTNPFGCTTATPISVTSVAVPALSPIALSLCVGANLDLTSLTGLAGLTNVFRTGNLLGLGTVVGTPTAISIGAGVNLFNVVSTNPLGCSAATPISVTGVPAPVVSPIALSLCVGTNLDLTSLTGLAGLTNVFRTGNLLGLGTVVGTPTAISIGAGVNLFNVVSTSPFGCTTATPISVTGVPTPVIGPLAISLCVGANLDLTSLSGLAGLTNIFRTGNVLGLGTIIGTPTAVTIGAGVNLFNVVSTSPFGCTTATPISVTAIAPPVVAPIALSLCVGANLDLTSLSGLAGLTNVFRTGNLLGLGTVVGTPASVNVGAGVNLFNVVSTSPLGCTTATPISVTGVDAPIVAPINLSLCVGANLDLTSLTSLAGLTNVFRTGNVLGLGTILGTPTAISIGAGVNLFNVVSTAPTGCTTATPISVTGVAAPVVGPLALSLCVGTNLDLTSLTGLAGLTNVFRTGNLLGLGTVVGTPTAVSIGAGVNLFNVVSTSPFGCTTATPISVTGVPAPVVGPFALSLCVGTNLDLTSLSGLAGLTNVFRTGNVLGLGTVLGTPTAISVGAGVNLFNVVSTSPFGCTTATPISVTGVDAPVVAPIALSLCVGTNLDLTSLSSLAGLTNVFRTGNLLGLGTVVGTPTAISVGAGVSLFNVVSTAPTGCTTATPISVTGVPTPVVGPLALSLCVGTNLDLTSLTGLAGLTNVFRTGNLLGLGTVVGTPTAVSIGAGVNLFNVVSTSPFGCTTATPISVTGVPAPVVGPFALSLCVGTNLDLTSLSGLAGLTNVFRSGNVLGLGTTLGTPTAVSIGAGVNLFNVVSTSPFGCTTATPISVTGVPAPVVGPINLSLCVGTNLDLTSLSGLSGLTNVFRTGNVLGLGTILGTPTAISVGVGVNLFNVVSTAPTGCTTATPISVVGVNAPVIAPIALSICAGTDLDLTSLSGLAGLTNVFRTGNVLGLGTILGTPNSVTIGAGVNLFNVVSTSPLGCTTATPISITGSTGVALFPINLSVCVGANLDLTSLNGLGDLNNVFRTGNVVGVGTIIGTPTAVSIGAGLNLFNVVSTTPLGCTTASPISITGVNPPVIAPIALSLCVGTNLDLTSLSGLAGLTNVFRTGGILGLGTILGTPTAVSVGVGVNLFNVVSTTPLGCSTVTPISVTGVNGPVLAPIALSLCAGTDLNLTSLSGLAGLTNVFRTGNVLGLGTVISTPTAVSIGAGVNLFNVVSTSPFGCTTATPISVTSVPAPVVAPIALSLCVGANLDLTSFTGLAGLTNVFRTGNVLGLGTILGTPTAISIGAGVNLFNVVSTAPTGCTTATPISVTGVAAPVVGPLALSLCVGTNLDLTSLSGLAGLTNVFRTGNVLGLGTIVGTPTAVSIGAGVNLFNVVSTSPFGCTTATPISVTGVSAPVVGPLALSLCVGANLDLTSLSGLSGLTNVFRTGDVLGLGTIIGTPTAVSVGVGVNLFNVVSTAPTGCTTATPISVTAIAPPVVAPIALSLCVGANLDLTSLSGLAGLTNVFRTGNLLGLGTVVNTPTSVSLGVGVNLFNVVSTAPTGCTTATPISVTGAATPVLSPFNMSLCAGVTLDLTSLSGLAGLTNVFRTGDVLGLGTVISTPTAVSIGVGVNLFNVVSTSPFGCTTAAPISVTGVNVPVTMPINLTLCAAVGTPVNLSALLSGNGSVAGLTNVFRLGGLGGSIVANPAAVSLTAGTNLFTVISTNPTGCTIITPIQVTLNVKPVVTVAAALQSQTICEGSIPQPIVGTVTSGTLASSLFFGPLSDTTSLFSTTVGTGLTFTPTGNQLPVPGQRFYFALVVNGTSTCSDTVFVSVTTNPRPIVTTTSLSICLGESVNLTAQLATQAGNTSAFFANRLDAQAQVNALASPIVTPTGTTTFFTRVALPVTGCFRIDSIIVTVKPKPSAGADQTLVCGPLGETPTSATLSASPIGGSWSNGVGNPTVATFTPNSASTTVGGLAVGSYRFIYTANGCTDTVAVVVPACQTFCAVISVTALASSNTVSPGQSVSLSAAVSPAGSYTYTWSGPGIITPTNGATVVASNLTTGVNTFTVAVTTKPGCTTTATVSVIVVAPNLTISVVDPGTCIPSTNSYTTSGIISLTNAVAGSLTVVDGIRSAVVSVTANQTTATFSLTGLVSGSGTHTVVVSGVAYPTASTTYVAPESCTVAACNYVVTATAASATVAQGQSASLAALVSPTGSYTYVWTAPAGVTITSANTATAVTSGLASGVYTFTVAVTKAPSCTQVATVCVSVPFTPCANSNYAYSLTTVAGFSNYQWQYTAPGSLSSTVVQTGGANSFIATLPGEYRVVVTDANGLGNCPGSSCCPIIIQELPAPVALSVTAIAATCSNTAPAAQDNAQLVLAGPVVAGTSYNISSGSTFSASGTLFVSNQPLTGLTTGSVLRTGLLNPPTAAGDTYTVRVFTVDGCFADTVVTIPRSDCQCPPAKCVPITVRKVVRAR